MIIQTTDEIRQFIAVNINNNVDIILPYIRGAETRIIEVMGVEQWQKLNDDYEGNSTAAVHLSLLELAQGANLHFAYLDYSFEGSFQITDTGFVTSTNSEERPLHQWEKIEFRKQRYNKGWEYLERIFTLLNSNKASYPEWAGSPTYQEQKSNFIYTAKEFSKYRAIEGYATLCALKGRITNVEESFIKNTLGEGLYNLLKSEVLTDSLSADNAALMPFVKEAVAHLSVYSAGEEIQFSLTAAGLRVSSVETQSGNIAKNAPASDNRMDLVFEKSKLKGFQALEELKKYLNTNASETKYPLYFTSGLYTSPDSADSVKFQNKNSKTFSKPWF